MPINPIQFQRGLSLPEFFERHGSEEQCEAALEQARWPTGSKWDRANIPPLSLDVRPGSSPDPKPSRGIARLLNGSSRPKERTLALRPPAAARC